MRALVFLLMALVSMPAFGSTLRTLTTMHGPTVYLRDLFDNAGANADRALGPGPEPGARIILGSAQLDAIARQYAVAWRSLSQADQSILEWPGRLIRKEEIIDDVHRALMAAGADNDSDIGITGFSPPEVPLDAKLTQTVSQLDYNGGTGGFTALLTFAAEGMTSIDCRIEGRLQEMTEAPVAGIRLQARTILTANDVHLARVPAALVQSDAAHTLDEVVGMQLRRPLAAGQPFPLAELSRPPLVTRGATVRIELNAGGLSVTGQAIAMDSGAEGERVRVQNINSRAYLFAQVVGSGRVRITPDTGFQAAPEPAAERGVR